MTEGNQGETLLKATVRKILPGYQRQETARFIDFRRHWDFAAEFCTPVEAHGKGGIEREAGCFREAVMVRRMKWELKLQ
jgi:hypothetical protein